MGPDGTEPRGQLNWRRVEMRGIWQARPKADRGKLLAMCSAAVPNLGESNTVDIYELSQKQTKQKKKKTKKNRRMRRTPLINAS